MNVIVTEQLTALGLLIDFLFGITLGVVYCAVHGSRRGVLLVPAADDLLSAGARSLYGFWARGYPQALFSGNDQASDDPSGYDGPEPHGRELNR
jgi:hypothetical protein